MLLKVLEVYVHNSDNPNSKAAISLGVSLLNESTQKLGFEKRGIKFANFHVLRETVFIAHQYFWKWGL